MNPMFVEIHRQERKSRSMFWKDFILSCSMLCTVALFVMLFIGNKSAHDRQVFTTAAVPSTVINEPTNDPIIITNIVTNTVYVTSPKTNIVWLASPITQNWELDEKNQFWKPIPKLNENYKYSPSIILGLREDGVVIWKKK